MGFLAILCSDGVQRETKDRESGDRVPEWLLQSQNRSLAPTSYKVEREHENWREEKKWKLHQIALAQNPGNENLRGSRKGTEKWRKETNDN